MHTSGFRYYTTSRWTYDSQLYILRDRARGKDGYECMLRTVESMPHEYVQALYDAGIIDCPLPWAQHRAALAAAATVLDQFGVQLDTRIRHTIQWITTDGRYRLVRHREQGDWIIRKHYPDRDWWLLQPMSPMLHTASNTTGYDRVLYRTRAAAVLAADEYQRARSETREVPVLTIDPASQFSSAMSKSSRARYSYP